jgi:hypothetical protein
MRGYIKLIYWVQLLFFAVSLGILLLLNYAKHQRSNSESSNWLNAIAYVPATYPAICGSVTDTAACASSMKLTAEANQSNYNWSTGATTPSIIVNTSGTYWWETIDLTNNKVVNGDFTSGRTGFTSGYTYIAPTGSTGGSGALSAEAYYTITTDPKISHTNFKSFPDHTANTSGIRNMMVVNGAPTAGITIWQQSINVQPNTDYVFSVWFTSVYPDNPGKLSFSINNVALGGPILLTSGTPDWKNYTVRWSSQNNTTAVIGIVNQNTATTGNDFALDDLVFAPVCRNTYNVTLSSSPPKPSITPQ